MLTFTRAGSTTLYVEDPVNSSNFGGIGFLAPDGTPHLPNQLTLEDAWFWRNQTLGDGWFVFIPPGTSFPDPRRESALLNIFIGSVRARLPRSPSPTSSGFVWINGDPHQPFSMQITRLDMIGTNSRRMNAKTARSDQTFEFQQFQVTVKRETEIRLLPDYSGFEIVTTSRTQAVQVRIPVRPFIYRLATNLTIMFEGDRRGGLQFTLEGMSANNFGYGSLDLSLFYYLRPNNPRGSGPPQILRYPLVDTDLAEGTFEFQATLFPQAPESSFFSLKEQSAGTPKKIASFFRTTAGYPVHLLPTSNAKFYLRSRPNQDRQIRGDTVYYLAPSGDFEIEAEGPLDPGTSITRILAGFSGTEYIPMKSLNGNGPGDRISFDIDQNAYAETFGSTDTGGGVLLTPDYKTPWVKIIGADGSERFFYAQPPDAPLYQAGGIFDGTPFLDFSEIRSASLTNPNIVSFPMAPVAGVDSGDIETYKAFEKDLLVPYRDQIIKRDMVAPFASPDRSTRRMQQTGATTEKMTTPQGLLVDVDVAANRYTKVLLGKLNGAELAIKDPTTDFQAALSSNKIFLVATHLANIGTFDDNTVSISSWNFVADIAATANEIKSIMVLKFADGTSFSDLVEDTSQWTNPDKFTDEVNVAAKLKTIIDDVRAKAASADTSTDSDAEILQYYKKFLETVIDAPNWSGIVVFDASLGNPNALPRQIRGLLPGMVVTKAEDSYIAPTNEVDPAFKAHHLRVDIAKVKQAADGTLEDIENSSMSALIDYENTNQTVTGVAKWADATHTATVLDAIGNVVDFSFRVKFMRITFENSNIKIFLSDVTLFFHKLFKEVPAIEQLPDGTTSVNSIDVSGSLQMINGIPTYVFRFGCIDPLKNNFIICHEKGLDGQRAFVKFPNVSPVITSIESTRVDYNMLQVGINVGDSNIAEFVIAGYMGTRELDSRDFFSYDRVGFGKLAMSMTYTMMDVSAMTQDIAKPQEMGNPFWIFQPNKMQFDTVRGEARDDSIVRQAPITVRGIAESVSTFSAADAGVFPIPNLVPRSAAMIPYQPASTSHAADPSPITYIISYGLSTAGLGLNVSPGGLVDILVHTGWKEATWNDEGDGVFYTALQWGTPLAGLDIGKSGMFKVSLADFGFGEVPTSTDERIFFIYVNSLAITVLRWQAKMSLMLFAPSPSDEGFAGAFGSGGANINSWFASFSLTKGSSGTSAIKSLPTPIVVAPVAGDPEFILAGAALDVDITRDAKQVPTKAALRVHGYVQNVKGLPGSSSITTTIKARLYKAGSILTPDKTQEKTVTWKPNDTSSSIGFEIWFPQMSWPGADVEYTADVRISGDFVSDKRSKRTRQTNTVTLRKDEGKPSNGSPIVSIDYVAIGRGVRLRRGSAPGGSTNLNVHPAPRTVGDTIALMQQMLPQGDSGPELYAVLRDIYVPSAGFMVGIDITIMGWLRLAVVADEADEIYGGLLEIKNGDKLPGFAKKLAGLRIEILYRRISDTSDLGVYEGTLTLPDILRYWDVGGFSITIPVISLQIYTDGGFLVDLGFPTGSFAAGYDFSRSFAIQGFIGPFPVMGAVGVYFGRLSAEAEYTIPDIKPDFGVWKSAWKFGLAAKLGMGKAYKRGPLSFELSLTAQLVFQGVAAAIDRASTSSDDNEAVPAPADYLMLEASLSIVLLAQGKFEVKVKGFGLSASLMVKASIGIMFRYMTATPIKIQLSITLEAELKVSLDLVLFSISISFHFTFKFQPTFTIPNHEHPDWIDHTVGQYPPELVDRGDNVLTSRLARPSRGLASLGLMATTVVWTDPGALWNDSFDSAFRYTDGDGNTVDLRSGGKLPITRVFAAPFTVNKSGELVSVSTFVIPELHARFVHAGIFVWAAKMVIGPSVNGATVLDAEDLEMIRSTISAEREQIDYDVLRSFLDANYAFSVVSAEDAAAEAILKPNGATETAAVVFPIDPDYRIEFDGTTVNFDEQTLRDNAYYRDLDDYLAALVLRAEAYLGDDAIEPTTPPTTERLPLAQHIFESYFELLVDTGVEDTIEAKVPRAADITEITGTWTLASLVADIIDQTNPLETKVVSGVASRLMMGGHQLPSAFTTTDGEPPRPTGFQPLYQLTGQQVVVDLGDKPDDGNAEDVIWSLSLKDGDDELGHAMAKLGRYDTLDALADDLAAAVGFGNGDEPRIVEQTPYLERNLSYPVDERIPFDSDRNGVPESTLMRFSTPLLQRLSGMDAGDRIDANLTKVTFAAEFSNEITATDTVSATGYAWALVIPFSAGRVIDALTPTSSDPANRTYLKDTYTLGGTDELTRGRIAELMTDLMNGDPHITNVGVIQSTDASGAAAVKPLDNPSRIVKTNLSTVSAPRGLRTLAGVTPPEEKYVGDLTLSDIFASLRLLWEASVVNAPGFFLEYEGPDGLPDDAFGGTDTADLSLVIVFSSLNGLPPYANSLIYFDRPAAEERIYIESLDDAVKTAVPTAVPGAVAYYAGRDIVVDSDSMDSTDPVFQTATLFNLVAFRIKDAGSHAGNWAVSGESWSLPYGPLKLDEAQLPDSVKTSTWKYEILVPWTKFLTGGRTQSPLFATTGALSPYDLAGGDLQLEFAALDTFGNQFPRTVDVTSTVRYTDPLVSIPQWPELKSAYHVNTAGQIVLILEFSADRLSQDSDATRARARALRAQYETIWFQLHDPNTKITLHTTLKAGDGEIGLADGSTINETLLGWVQGVLTYLNAKVGGTAATAPAMKVITTSAIDRATRDAQTENIHPLRVSVQMSRPESMVDTDAAARIQAIGSITSDFKADTELTPELPEFGGEYTGLASDSLVGFAQKFEAAFPELRVATGDGEGNDQSLWTIRMGRGLGDSGPGIRVNVQTGQRSYFGTAPLSTQFESCIIADPDDPSATVQFDNVDMDKLGRRFVALIDDMLSETKVVKLRRAAQNDGDYIRVLDAKQKLAAGVPNGMLSIFTESDNETRRTASREILRQSLLKSLSAAYDVDTVISYDVTVSNSETVSGTPPNLFGRIISLDPANENEKEQAFVVGTAKIRLGNDANGNPPKLSFTFSTDRDSEQAQMPVRLAYQITYVEHDIQTDEPAWAPPGETYEYRGSNWLKLILPDNQQLLEGEDLAKLPNNPIQLSTDEPTNIPIPLREIPTTPVVLRQLGTPEVAAGDSVTLDKAAAWEYEYQIERPRAAQDRIYLHVSFNKKQQNLALLADEETLLHALCRFDLKYRRLIGADKSVAEQTQPEPADLLTLLPYIEEVADKWGTWEPSVPIVQYTWAKDDWAYYMSETINSSDLDHPSITIALKPLSIKEPVGGKTFGDFPEIRVPDPLGNGSQELTHAPAGAAPGDEVSYSFIWSGAIPENQTRSFVFSDLNVLKTENARGRMWLTRNENLGEDDGFTTNERFVYRSGASEFTEPVQPFIDRTVPVDIIASVPEPSSQTLAGYLEKLFTEIFSIAIDNGYPWPLTKVNCRYGYDPRNLVSPPTGPDPDDQFIVYLPVLEHVPFTPSSASGFANDVQTAIQTWEQHVDIPNSPTRGTGFYEFDLSVFSTLNRTDTSMPMLRLRRLWIKRFD